MSIHPYKYYYFILVFFCSLHANAFNYLHINANNEDRLIPDVLYQLYEDTSNSLTINDVTAQNFPFNKGNKLIKNPNSTYWIRLAIKGDTSIVKKWVLEVYNVHINHLSLFSPQHNGKYIESKTGFDLTFKEREYKTINFVFDIDGHSKKTNNYYFKIQADNPTWFESHLRTNNYYTSRAVKEYYFLGIFYGIVIIMAIYNLMIFFSTREVVYIYYVIYVLLSGFYCTLDDGTGFAHLWPDLPNFSATATKYSRLLWILSFVIYSKKFLKIQTYYPIYNKWLNIVVGLYIILFSIDKIFGYSVLLYQAYFAPYIFLFIISILIWKKKKYTPARFYVYALSVVLTSLVVLIMRDRGYVIDFGNKVMTILIVYAINFSIVIELIFLSFALGNRIKFLKTSNEVAQAKTITQLKENEALKDKVNRELEGKVQERTKELNKKNKDIIDSINYAQRIQTAVLPGREMIERIIPNNFIFHRSKGIVSGDFLWVEELANKKYFSVIDCTGHGVPGAFMSIMANNNLNYLLKEKQLQDPGEILENLDEKVKLTIKQSNDDFNDLFGMDMSLCVLDYKANKLEFAGAFNPLWFYDGTNIQEIKAERYPIGHYFYEPEQKVFKTNQVDVKPGDRIYLFSDGYQDQFGGPNGDKFLKEKLKELLLTSAHLSLTDQNSILEKTFDDWKGDYEQIDDVTVLCVEI